MSYCSNTTETGVGRVMVASFACHLTADAAKLSCDIVSLDVVPWLAKTTKEL